MRRGVLRMRETTQVHEQESYKEVVARVKKAKLIKSFGELLIYLAVVMLVGTILYLLSFVGSGVNLVGQAIYLALVLSFGISGLVAIFTGVKNVVESNLENRYHMRKEIDKWNESLRLSALKERENNYRYDIAPQRTVEVVRESLTEYFLLNKATGEVSDNMEPQMYLRIEM